MTKPKAQNPDMDFGFYASIPRIVRTEYKEVTPVQKWLYVCLKDLAGDDGTCYRTIRALMEETGLSAGLISESIPVLHKVGLIHAEKKKRSSGGKEVWHISIVDIWKKNGDTHPTKRSPHEQTSNVHKANVHLTNNNTPECSPDEHKRSRGEQECSRGETEERTLSRTISKTIIEEKESAYKGNVSSDEQEATASTRTPSSVQEKIIDSDSHQPQGVVANDNNNPPHHDSSASSGNAAQQPGNTNHRENVAGSKQEKPVSVAGGRDYTQAQQVATRPAASARQEKPKIVMPSLFASTPERPVLTPEGANVREWYALIRLTKVRLTKENILACNGLAECDGISFENLKAAIEHWDEDDYVKSKGIVVDLQMLEKSGGAFSFEKAMIAIRKQRQAEAARASKDQSSQVQKTVSGLKRFVANSLVASQQ